VRAVAGLIASHVESPSSISDAIEIVHAWSAGGFDMKGFLTRALVHRATYIPIGSKEECSHLRKRLLACALKLVPSSQLKVIVESTVDCLTQMLEDICENNNGEHDDDDDDDDVYFGELFSLEDREQYSVCCESALYILSWYLDEKKGLPESRLGSLVASVSSGSASGSMLASNDNHHSDTYDNLVEASSFPLSFTGDSSTLFSCVHYGTLLALKKLRLIQKEFGLYLPPTAINDAEVCQEMVGRIAERHVEELLELIPKMCDGIQAAAIVESDALVTLRHRRICAALNVSLVYFSHRIVKCLFRSSQKVCAFVYYCC